MEPLVAQHKKSGLSSVMQYIKLLRVSQWVKNFFVFIPTFFAGEIFHLDKIGELLLAFLSFSFVASSIYILNDYRDIESDRKHPKKCKRPLAAGTVSKPAAWVLFIIFCTGGLLLAYIIKLKFFAIIAAYFLLNLGYCLGLKNISILDIIIIAIGFVLRVKGGGIITSIPVSEWLVIMVFLLALFLAITKRRDDLYIKQSSGLEMRVAIKGYSLELLNILLAVISSILIIAYIMYTVSPVVTQRYGAYRLYYTSLFVIAGAFRYLQITYINKDSSSPTKNLYKDLFIQIVLVLWILSFYIILYLPDFQIFS